LTFSRLRSIGPIIFVSILGSAATGFAVPQLQLDIIGGTYDEASETIIAPAGNVIDLVALFTPNGNPSQDEIDAMLDGTFDISAALIGAGDVEEGSLGSFSIDGETVVDVPEGMVYGVPPVEQLGGDPDFDSHDLSQHDIFEAYFYELEFQFFLEDTAITYNTQDMPGGLVLSEDGETFYRTFSIDTTNLAAGAQLHFDLYTTDLDNAPELLAQPLDGNNDVDRVLFAPFSHDAETNRLLPEPTMLWLLAAGFLGVGLTRRRRSR
jgi:hypothetical protein